MREQVVVMCQCCGGHATVRWCDVYHTKNIRHRCEACKDKPIPEVYVKVEWADPELFEKGQHTWRLIDNFVFQPNLGKFIQLKLIDKAVIKKFEECLAKGESTATDGFMEGIYRFTVTGKGESLPQPEEPCPVCFAREAKANNRVNLKKILMELGNKLVTEYGFHPASTPAKNGEQSTEPIRVFTEWLNSCVEAQQALKSLEVDWPVVIPQNYYTDVQQVAALLNQHQPGWEVDLVQIDGQPIQSIVVTTRGSKSIWAVFDKKWNVSLLDVPASEQGNFKPSHLFQTCQSVSLADFIISVVNNLTKKE
jgi:hypothetical protein